MAKDGFFLDSKKLHIILSMLAILLTILGSLIYPFVWKSQVDRDLDEAKKEIKVLKDNKVRDHELLIEIKLNLRHYLQSQGYNYIENDNIEQVKRDN